jgi:amino acid transporter
VPELDIVWTSFGIIAFFAFLTLIGLRESSVIAYGIFIGHMVTLSVLTVSGLKYMFEHPGVIVDNYLNAEYPEINLDGHMLPGNFFMALYFGFSSALLGVTGFETSANFVEEQQVGVFSKTLRVRPMNYESYKYQYANMHFFIL